MRQKYLTCNWSSQAANYLDIKGPAEPDLPERHGHDEEEDSKGQPRKVQHQAPFGLVWLISHD